LNHQKKNMMKKVYLYFNQVVSALENAQKKLGKKLLLEVEKLIENQKDNEKYTV